MARKKKDFPWLLIGAALVTFVVAVLLFAMFGERLFPPEKPPQVRTVVLYFSDDTGKRLVPTKHTIKRGTLEEEITRTLKALRKPPSPPLVRTIPDGVRILSVRVKEKTAYVDFSKELVRNHPGGSSAELQTVYSIVNTVALNFPQVERVQILVEGSKRKTLAGHLLINMPLRANTKLIKG